MADVRDRSPGVVPAPLRDGHYPGAARLSSAIPGKAQRYRYPHDDPDAVVAQQYPPDELVGRDYYQPGEHGAERSVADRLARLRAVIRGPRTR
jgi:putative ATPase